MEDIFDCLTQMAEDAECKVSLRFRSLSSNLFDYGYMPFQRTVSASTIKTAVMLYALREMQEGRLSKEQSIAFERSIVTEDSRVFAEWEGSEMSLDALLRWMIVRSDNTATNILIDFLGMDKLNAYFETLGLLNTRLERHMLDFDAVQAGHNNYTCADDMRVIFSGLHAGTLVNRELSAYGLDILLGQRDFEVALRYIPEYVKCAHKSGGLEGLSHDTGIVWLDNICFFFGIFVSEAPDSVYAQRLAGRIFQEFYDFARQIQ